MTGELPGKRTFFLRLAGREGEGSSGRSETKSLRAESRRARWGRFPGLGMMKDANNQLCEKEKVQEAGHAGCRMVDDDVEGGCTGNMGW